MTRGGGSGNSILRAVLNQYFDKIPATRPACIAQRGHAVLHDIDVHVLLYKDNTYESKPGLLVFEFVRLGVARSF
jgi:hypothetical protein